MTAELVIPARATISEKMEYARTLAGANLLPDVFRRNPENVLWAIEYAEALRLPTIAAITGIHVIEGKPAPSASLMSALVRRAGHKLRVGYDPSATHGLKGRGWCEIVRGDDPDFTFRAEWTVERARDAELCRIVDGQVIDRTRNNKTGNWQKHYIGMLKRRSTSECARDACEEALIGMHYLPEELGADVDPDGAPVRGSATIIDLNTRGAGRAEQGTDRAAGGTAEAGPEWGEEIDRCERELDRDGLVALYRRAGEQRPDDGELQALIVAAGERVKAARESEPVDAEVVDDQPPPDDAERRNARMFALLGEAGLGGKDARDRRLSLMGNVLGAQVGSSNELSYDDRERVIAALERWQRNGDLERAEECAEEEAAIEQMASEGEAPAESGGDAQ